MAPLCKGSWLARSDLKLYCVNPKSLRTRLRDWLYNETATKSLDRFIKNSSNALFRLQQIQTTVPPSFDNRFQVSAIKAFLYRSSKSTSPCSSRHDFLSALSRTLKRVRPECRSLLFTKTFCKQNVFVSIYKRGPQGQSRPCSAFFTASQAPP